MIITGISFVAQRLFPLGTRAIVLDWAIGSTNQAISTGPRHVLPVKPSRICSQINTLRILQHW